MQATATIATGSYSNGSTDASVSPSLLAGKGFGNFDVFSTLGGNAAYGGHQQTGTFHRVEYYRAISPWEYVSAQLGGQITHFVGGNELEK